MYTLFKRNSTKLLTIICTILALTSCKRNKIIQVQGEAEIKVVNTVLGSDSQDFYQNETKLSTTAIAYGEDSEYLKIKVGSSTIAVKDEATQLDNATSTVNPGVNVSYIVFYYKNLAGKGLLAGYENDNTLPAMGKARVRFLNLYASTTSLLTISYVSGPLINKGLPFALMSGYHVVDAGFALNVSVFGSTELTLIPASSIQADKNYTIWFDYETPTTVKCHIIEE